MSGHFTQLAYTTAPLPARASTALLGMWPHAPPHTHTYHTPCIPPGANLHW